MAGATTRRPRRLDGAGIRAATYVRVSTEEQVDGYSLAAQERAIEAFCQSKGWEIVARFRDEGKSARTDVLARRPDFSRMLDAADAGQFDVVVVHKLDRFARNMRVTLDTLARLDRSGAAFVSISEQMDFTTPIGKVILATLAAFAQYYSDNLATETAKGKQERKRQGLYNGVLPFGTAKGDDGVPVLDHTPRWQVPSGEAISPAAGLRLMFDLAADGRSDRDIARAMNAAGYRTTGNRGENPFTKDSVRVILTNRFYLGELPTDDGGSQPGKHGALIDPALFDRAETMRARNLHRPLRVGQRQAWALSGLAVCGRCGESVTAVGHNTGRRRCRCAGRTQGNGCDERGAYLDAIEAEIGAYLSGFAVPDDHRGPLMAAWRRSRSQPANATAERARLRGKLARLQELYVEGEIDKARYTAERDVIVAGLAGLPAEPGTDDAAGRLLLDFMADVSKAWTLATPGERNQLARQLFDRVVIFQQRAAAIVPRKDFRPFFEAEAVKRGANVFTGGSDGGPFSTFRTSPAPAGRSASRCPTSGLPPSTPLVGRPARGPTTLPPAATPAAPAS